MKNKIISNSQCLILLNHLENGEFDKTFIPDKNKWVIYKDQEAILQLRLPITYELDKHGRLIGEEGVNYVLLMIRSGIASIGYFERGVNLDHKVFRAYMVRKKQGTSQIKHLKTKGKSRAGSRVRLAETLDFFEDINIRMQGYFSMHRIDRIGISCATTLIPYLFGSKTATAFDKNDRRILKIPKHVQNPTYEALLEVNEFLKKGELKSSDSGEVLFDQFVNKITETDADVDTDDW
ncbi:hypothetical protein [Anditalea andensis]|uniref:VLRF1 domain-containing protein n=1 Tax=Anditalea andensis TaxID=1048983 RepID=A0A074KVH7_9BACT|nr:hypothetical protein [Anditalea andensis]KEO73981.1 hypothetical protein EL17_07455 [Anditalea andensis]